MYRMALVLCIVALPCCSAFPQNPLDNPSFEEIDAAGAAVGWTLNGGAELVAEPGDARKGAHAARVRFDDPVTSRPDLALSPDDVRYENGTLTVTIHNLGAAPSPSTTLQVQDAQGNALAEADVPPIEAPLDLKPRTAEVEVTVEGRLGGEWRVVLGPGNEVEEGTEANNATGLPRG